MWDISSISRFLLMECGGVFYIPDNSDSSLKISHWEYVQRMANGQISFHRKGNDSQNRSVRGPLKIRHKVTLKSAKSKINSQFWSKRAKFAENDSQEVRILVPKNNQLIWQTWNEKWKMYHSVFHVHKIYSFWLIFDISPIANVIRKPRKSWKASIVFLPQQPLIKVMTVLKGN